jgi:hypothetical protein
MAGIALPLVCDCERMDGRPPIPGMDKSQKLRLRVLLVDATSTDGASATPGWTSLEAEPSAGGDHRRLPGVDGSDDLGVVDALAINRRDAEVGMPQLALDDIERHPFVGELHAGAVDAPGRAHHRYDRLDGGRIGRVAEPLVTRRAPGEIAGQGDQRAAAAGGAQQSVRKPRRPAVGAGCRRFSNSTIPALARPPIACRCTSAAHRVWPVNSRRDSVRAAIPIPQRWRPAARDAVA